MNFYNIRSAFHINNLDVQDTKLFNCLIVIIILLNLFSILLSSIAISSSTIESLNHIYFIRLNLQDLKVSKTLIPIIPEHEFITLHQLGLSEIYSFTLWGYCKGSTVGKDEYKIEYCSEHDSIYSFDPVEVLNEDLRLNSKIRNGQDLQIRLSREINNSIEVARTLSKLIFINGSFGICLNITSLLITIYFTLFKTKQRYALMITCVIINICASFFTGISGSNAVGCFSIVKRQFNDSFGNYGISSDFGNYFFYLSIFVSCLISFICSLVNSVVLLMTGIEVSHQNSEAEKGFYLI